MMRFLMPLALPSVLLQLGHVVVVMAVVTAVPAMLACD